MLLFGKQTGTQTLKKGGLLHKVFLVTIMLLIGSLVAYGSPTDQLMHNSNDFDLAAGVAETMDCDIHSPPAINAVEGMAPQLISTVNGKTFPTADNPGIGDHWSIAVVADAPNDHRLVNIINELSMVTKNDRARIELYANNAKITGDLYTANQAGTNKVFVSTGRHRLCDAIIITNKPLSSRKDWGFLLK